MADFRQVFIRVWDDPFFFNLDKGQKILWLYLLTNPSTTQSGIYQIPIIKVCFHTQMSKEEVLDILKFFITSKKIDYNFETEEVCILNHKKYNVTTGAKIESLIKKELNLITDSNLVEKIYPISNTGYPISNTGYPIQKKTQHRIPYPEKNTTLDTLSIPYPESEIPYPKSENNPIQSNPIKKEILKEKVCNETLSETELKNKDKIFSNEKNEEKKKEKTIKRTYQIYSFKSKMFFNQVMTEENIDDYMKELFEKQKKNNIPESDIAKYIPKLIKEIAV